MLVSERKECCKYNLGAIICWQLLFGSTYVRNCVHFQSGYHTLQSDVNQLDEDWGCNLELPLLASNTTECSVLNDTPKLCLFNWEKPSENTTMHAGGISMMS